MNNKLRDGDYVRTADGLDVTELSDELLQNAEIILKAKKGRFYPDKNFGRRIGKAPPEQSAEYALAFAREALNGADGIYVIGAEINDSTIDFTLMINHEERQVSIKREENI